MGMSLSKFQDIVKDREAWYAALYGVGDWQESWHAAVHRVAKSQT